MGDAAWCGGGEQEGSPLLPEWSVRLCEDLCVDNLLPSFAPRRRERGGQESETAEFEFGMHELPTNLPQMEAKVEELTSLK